MQCTVCGAAEGGCSHGEAPSGLELDLGRAVPPSAKIAAPLTRPHVRAAPLPPPPDSGGIIPSAVVKLGIALGVLALLGGSIWFGVMKLKSGVDSVLDEADVRPYAAPNRLVIASVAKDYGSEIVDDGAILLRKMPVGPAVGLAGWYRPAEAPAQDFFAQAVAKSNGNYRALEAPAEPCRSDAETSTTTFGELTFPHPEDNVTIWTCTLTKKNHAYFLAWAMRSSDVDTNKQRVTMMVKGSQLVDNGGCSANIINGGCHASATALITKLIEHALE